MRFACVSDLHGLYSKFFEWPVADVLLIAGDSTRTGSLADLMQFNAFLESLPYSHKIMIAGNHDFIFQQPGLAKSVLTDTIYLQDEMIELEGIKIYGMPWVPECGRWAFQATYEDMPRHTNKIPDGLDILITHGPPQGVLDMPRIGWRVGCESLASAVIAKKPRFHVFGHIHEAAGMFLSTDTTFINAAATNAWYELVNPPIVFTI